MTGAFFVSIPITARFLQRQQLPYQFPFWEIFSHSETGILPLPFVVPRVRITPIQVLGYQTPRLEYYRGGVAFPLLEVTTGFLWLPLPMGAYGDLSYHLNRLDRPPPGHFERALLCV